MIDVEGIVGLLLLGLWLYCIFDVIATEGATVRNLPKGVWLVVVLILPDIGSIAWLILGRPEKAGWRPGDTEVRRSVPRARPVGPEDSADFIARIEARDRMLEAWAQEDQTKDQPALGAAHDEQERQRLAAWEADLARREADLRRPDDPASDAPA